MELCSLPVIYLGPDYGGGNEDNGDLLQKVHACTATHSAPSPAAGHHRPAPPPETAGHSQASLGQSLVGSLLLSPGTWCTQGSVCALQASLAGMRLNFKPNCDPHASFSVSSSLLLHVGYLFLVGSNILLSIAVQQPVVMLVLLQKMSIHPSTLPSLSQLFVT